jgi:hypothetical protein
MLDESTSLLDVPAPNPDDQRDRAAAASAKSAASVRCPRVATRQTCARSVGTTSMTAGIRAWLRWPGRDEGRPSVSTPAVHIGLRASTPPDSDELSPPDATHPEERDRVPCGRTAASPFEGSRVPPDREGDPGTSPLIDADGLEHLAAVCRHSETHRPAGCRPGKEEYV